MRALLLLTVVGVVGCTCNRVPDQRGGGDTVAPRPAVDAVRVVGPDGAERLEPRFGRGEQLALAFELRRAMPPLRAALAVFNRHGAAVSEQPEVPLQRGTAPNSPWFLPFTLPTALPSGAYDAVATIRGRRGLTTRARSRLLLVSASPSAPATMPDGATTETRHGARLTIHDAAGLPRTRFARGETAMVTMRLPPLTATARLRLRLTGEDGLFWEEVSTHEPTPSELTHQARLVVSPVARAGPCHLTASLAGPEHRATQATVTLQIVGVALDEPPELIIESSEVAGAGRRRQAQVSPPAIPVQVRLAGYRVERVPTGWRVRVTARATLRRADGTPLTPTQPVGHVDATLPYRPLRLDIAGAATLPRVPPGELLLELTATDELALEHQRAVLLRHVLVP